mmetsp:Transcript_22476/g.35321  ORF Transcript_22476/g.35321 Transcript_22476/m.35321 type:complete len:165 (-) Transcript_22476:74-568(-)
MRKEGEKQDVTLVAKEATSKQRGEQEQKVHQEEPAQHQEEQEQPQQQQRKDDQKAKSRFSFQLFKKKTPKPTTSLDDVGEDKKATATAVVEEILSGAEEQAQQKVAVAEEGQVQKVKGVAEQQTEKKTGFLRNIFGRKKEEDKTTTTAPDQQQQQGEQEVQGAS